MNKIQNKLKSDTNALINIIDISLGGTISIIKNSLVSSYQGYLEEKLNGLIIDILNNNIEEKELNDFITNLIPAERDLLYVVIKKAMESKDDIIIYILAKLLSQQIRNSKLSYFEETLLVNIDKFIEADFKNYIVLINKLRDSTKNTIKTIKDEEEISLIKFINIGVFKIDRKFLVVDSSTFVILKTEFSDELYEICQKFLKK